MLPLDDRSWQSMIFNCDISHAGDERAQLSVTRGAEGMMRGGTLGANSLSVRMLSRRVSEDYGDMDDSSDQTPSKASKSPQKSSKRPKTVPVKVNLLDGSQYETGVEVCVVIGRCLLNCINNASCLVATMQAVLLLCEATLKMLSQTKWLTHKITTFHFIMWNKHGTWSGHNRFFDYDCLPYLLLVIYGNTLAFIKIELLFLISNM